MKPPIQNQAKSEVKIMRVVKRMQLRRTGSTRLALVLVMVLCTLGAYTLGFVPGGTVRVLAASDTVAVSGTAATFVDFSQCANESFPSNSVQCPQNWINGILQTSNSHYSEDTVVPQRFVAAVPTGGSLTGRTI